MPILTLPSSPIGLFPAILVSQNSNSLMALLMFTRIGWLNWALFTLINLWETGLVEFEHLSLTRSTTTCHMSICSQVCMHMTCAASILWTYQSTGAGSHLRAWLAHLWTSAKAHGRCLGATQWAGPWMMHRLCSSYPTLEQPHPNHRVCIFLTFISCCSYTMATCVQIVSSSFCIQVSPHAMAICCKWAMASSHGTTRWMLSGTMVPAAFLGKRLSRLFSSVLHCFWGLQWRSSRVNGGRLGLHFAGILLSSMKSCLPFTCFWLCPGEWEQAEHFLVFFKDTGRDSDACLCMVKDVGKPLYRLRLIQVDWLKIDRTHI